MQVHVIEVDWATHQDALHAIRNAVFVAEQGVPPELEWDGEDDACRHFLAVDEAGVNIGCARLMPSRQIGRMAVLPPWRGRNHGRALLDAAIEAAMQDGANEVHLHAQASAIDFYRKRGFLPVGPRFSEAGIEHQEMRLPLPLRFEASPGLSRPVVPERQPDTKHADAGLILMGDTVDAQRALEAITSRARRQLDLFSRLLDPALLDRPEFVERISELAREHRHAEIRLLIGPARPVVQRGHRLLDLARRLDSKITIRSTDEADEARSFAIVDRDSYWVLPDATVHEGSANIWDPVLAGRLLERFDQLWAGSIDDPELRTLSL